MKRTFVAIVAVLLTFSCSFAGSLQFEWEGGGSDPVTGSVYTLRLTKLNLSNYLPVYTQDYKATGVTSIVVSDLCNKFYPAKTDSNRYGLVAKVGGYARINNSWVWLGWSHPVVLDLWGDCSELCESGNSGVINYNLPYPTHLYQ